MSAADSFLKEIEDFLALSGESPTAFGKAVASDPSFVPDLRKGRAPSLRLVDRVRAYITRRKAELAEIGRRASAGAAR